MFEPLKFECIWWKNSDTVLVFSNSRNCWFEMIQTKSQPFFWAKYVQVNGYTVNYAEKACIVYGRPTPVSSDYIFPIFQKGRSIERLTFEEFPMSVCPAAKMAVALKPLEIQSTLVISNSKGLPGILHDIRTSTYQNCRIEEKINRTTTFNKCICNWTLKIRDIETIVEKRRKFLLFSTIFCYLLFDFHL